MAACALVFTGCSNDDDEPNLPNPDVPTKAEGVFVLNQGNYTLQMEGSLTHIDYDAPAASQNVFMKANGRSLGSTPQGAVTYGGKIYIGMYESNVIEVVDRATFRSLKQISLSGREGQSPRSLVAKDGKVYISMYDGYVSRLDTLTLDIDKTVKVGPNPDVIAIRGNYLYVPNSDGLNWQNGYGTTASKIDLATFSVEKTFTTGLNPTEFASNGTDLFLLCKGNYSDVMSTVYRVDADDRCTEVAEATIMAVSADKLHYINAPFWETKFTYVNYDIATGKKTDMLNDSGVDSPAAMGVDPVNGNIVITSYKLDNGVIGYTSEGYAKVYDRLGNFVRRYEVGVAPCAVFFNYK